MLTWASLRSRALDETDAAWFGAVAPILVDRARQSRLGRRMLARRLAANGAPLLFGTMPRSTPQAIAVSTWAGWPVEKLRAIALDLGAIALAPALRSLVRRETVLRIRRVLGESRYGLALADGGERQAAVAARVRSTVTTALERDEDLDQLVRKRGFGEFLAFARAVHPVCAERLLLCEPPGSVVEARVPWLAGARVATYLSALPAADDEGIHDGTSRRH